MKFSNDTLRILKNFSEINQGIHFKQGNVLTTLHPQKFVLAEAAIGESLPNNFAIYDLNKFLSITSLFGEPEFDFKDDRVVVSKENRCVNYVYAQQDMVLDPGDRPDKYRKQTIAGKIATATLGNDDLKSLKQAASVLNLPDIHLIGKNNKITITAKDMSNSSTNTFDISIDADVVQDFDSVLRFEHLKVLDGDYELVCHPKLAYFKLQNAPVEYWIAFHQQAE